LTVVAAPCFADDSTEDEGALIINGQLNLAPVFSELDTVIVDVDGDASAAATAVGNQVTIITNTDTTVHNNQYMGDDVGSVLSADVQRVDGDVSLTATSMCNGASVSTDPYLTKVVSTQSCGGRDPWANVSANVGDVDGLVGINAHSVGNQIEIDSDARRFPVKNWQENHAGTYSSVNANVRNVGAVGVTSTAVGNTAQIIHLGSGGH
jgi:hypothetical protein